MRKQRPACFIYLEVQLCSREPSASVTESRKQGAKRHIAHNRGCRTEQVTHRDERDSVNV